MRTGSSFANHATAINVAIIQGAMPALVLIGGFFTPGTRIRSPRMTSAASDSRGKAK
jgi:hypothetical protein